MTRPGDPTRPRKDSRSLVARPTGPASRRQARLRLMFLDVDEPIRVVVENSPAPTTPWLPLLGSVLVAVITAGGVIFAAYRNSRAALQAENSRHRHDIDASSARWHRDKAADAYFLLIDASHRAIHAARQFVWFSRPNLGEDEYEATNPTGIQEQIKAWNQATIDLRRAEVMVLALGDPQIAKFSHRIVDITNKTIQRTIDVVHQVRETGDFSLFDADLVAKKHRLAARREVRRLIKAVRADLAAGVPGMQDSGADIPPIRRPRVVPFGRARARRTGSPTRPPP